MYMCVLPFRAFRNSVPAPSLSQRGGGIWQNS